MDQTHNNGPRLVLALPPLYIYTITLHIPNGDITQLHNQTNLLGSLCAQSYYYTGKLTSPYLYKQQSNSCVISDHLSIAPAIIAKQLSSLCDISSVSAPYCLLCLVSTLNSTVMSSLPSCHNNTLNITQSFNTHIPLITSMGMWL